MTSKAEASVRVRRSAPDIAAFVTDPHRSLPLMSGMARLGFIRELEERGHEEWQIFLSVGSLQLGGAADVDRSQADRLTWRSIRGTRNTFEMVVSPVDGETAELTMRMQVSLAGLLMSRIAEFAAKGIMQRHLEAGLQELRHHLEFEDQGSGRPDSV